MKKDDNSLHEDLRKSSIRLGLLWLPTAVAGLATVSLMNKFAAQPYQTLWILVPLAVLDWIFWQVAKGRKEFRLSGLFLAFLLTYVVIFSVAAGSELLVWRRTLRGYEKSVPRNWLSLGWMGDWRYWIVRKKPATRRLTIVTMQRTNPVWAGRVGISELVRLAVENGAKGIALDYYFEKVSPVDSRLCQAVEQARENDVPVLVCYNVSVDNGEPSADPIADSLEECLPRKNQGYPAGYTESDEVIRMIPLYFKGTEYAELEAFSLKTATQIAELWGKEIKAPENGLLQFIKPKDDFKRTTYSDLLNNPRPMLEDQFVLVGEESDKHKFSTPFGEESGLVIQAYAVHSLLQNHFIKRTTFWPNYLMILVFCYLITVRVKQGDSVRKLIRTNSLISCVIFAISALAIYISLVWIDIIYSLLALWLLLPLLLVLRKTSNR